MCGNNDANVCFCLKLIHKCYSFELKDALKTFVTTATPGFKAGLTCFLLPVPINAPEQSLSR